MTKKIQKECKETFRIISFVVLLAIETLLSMTGSIISLIALSKATPMILWNNRRLSASQSNPNCVRYLCLEASNILAELQL
jgi:hypothetical protein